MAINPINVSRVTSTLRTDAMLTSLRRNTLELFLEQNRLSIGRQFLAPSENPRAAARALNLNEILDQQSQLVTNIRHGANTLDATDSAMAEVSALIIDAQSVASQNIGSLSSPDERKAAAEIIAAIRNQLVAVGNRTFEGRYLFAGRRTNEQPFVETLNGVRYRGDHGDILARTDINEQLPINLPGSVLFGAVSNAVAPFVDLDPALTEATRIEDLVGAAHQGVFLGSFQIVEEGGSTVTVDITGADTLGDVVNLINAAAEEAGAGFTASLSATGLVVSPGGAQISIRDIATGTTARDLGIVSLTPSGAAINGIDLGVQLTRTTRLEHLAGGAGIDVSSGLIISNGNLTATIDLSTAETIQDVLNAINNASLSAEARINAARNGIEVVNTLSGSTLSVGENGGQAATLLGIRTLHGGTAISEINNGYGLRTVDGRTDISITDKAGNTVEVNLDGVTTIQEVIDAINLAATTGGVGVTADLAPTGNGIRLTDTSGGMGRLTVGRANLSFAIDDLGLNFSVDPTATEMVSQDFNGLRVNSVLTALFDLERALRDDDSQGITLAAEDMDTYLVDFNRARGQVGARAKGMQDRLQQTESAVFATQSFLSEVQDLDYTEAVTKFQQAQTALQATLLTGSQLLQTSLLNFLQ